MRVTTGFLVAVLVGSLGAGCATEQVVPAAPAPAPPAPTAPTGEPRALPGYYVAETTSGPRLFREFRRVTTADPASDAVREMLRGPVDPDYRTLWPAGTALRSPVTVAGGVITVDLSREALGPASLGTAAADLTVQQLVFTVQAALQSVDPVRLLVDGAPVPELFGAVATAEPVPRADQYAVRSLVQIDNPTDGAAVGRSVTVSGEAAAFEANVPWQVLRDGAVVQEGFTTAAEGQRFAAFSFTLTLEPGTYDVVVTEDDPSGGEGRPPFVDDKTITVG
ncbi:MAG: GerMN domain-containing protein [Pseudonocardia sp.]